MRVEFAPHSSYCVAGVNVAPVPDHANARGKVQDDPDAPCESGKRVVVSACSCRLALAAKPRYRTLAGERGLVQTTCSGDIVALPRPDRELAEVDDVIMVASTNSLAVEAAKQAGQTGISDGCADQVDPVQDPSKDVPDHALLWFAPFEVE